MSKITAILMLGCVAGCATVASGPYGVPLDEHGQGVVALDPAAPQGGLKVSAGGLPGLASRYFGAVEVTFENPSPVWVQIDRVDMDFGGPQRNQAVFVPWGADIDAWRQAAVDSLAIQRANGTASTADLLELQMLAVGGDALAARDRRDDRGSATGGARGGFVAISAQGTVDPPPEPAAGDAPEKSSPSFPPSHLLSLPIRVPPGLFAKRWIVFYTSDNPPGGCIESMVLGYTANGKRERVAVTFKSPGSAWQRRACGGKF